MKINEKFQTIMTKEVMAQKDTPKHNTICTVGGCYSNCHPDCELDFILDPKEIGKRCSVFQNYGVEECYVCGHSSNDHRHYHSIWAAISEQEAVLDKRAKAQYDQAKEQAVTLEMQTQAIENALRQMNDDITNAEGQIGLLCTKFGECALSGSFAGHLNAAIRMLTLRYEGMKNSDADEASLRRMEQSIDHIQKKLAIVQRASGSGLLDRRGPDTTIVQRTFGSGSRNRNGRVTVETSIVQRASGSLDRRGLAANQGVSTRVAGFFSRLISRS
jgi:hypothetical protein